MKKMKLHSPNLTNENIAKIRDLFPGCVTEATDESGKLRLAVDFDQLRQELSGHIAGGGGGERYRLDWPGKREALLTANTPIAKTLRPSREESVDFETTQNLFIEGDNLDALKLLQETYLGKVKMIYIDPPYNTGKDFVYKDNFAANKQVYLEDSGQVDEEGGKLVSNSESNGRFHSDWLSMMYPRLKLARNLLKDDGVIFISIGVEEFANLKNIVDEVFGETNFVEVFSWVKTSTPPALSTKSRRTNEYILCYEKNRSSIKYNGELLDGGDAPLLNRGNSVQKLKFPKEKVFFSFIENGQLEAGKNDRVRLLNDMKIKNGYSTQDFELEGEFKWSQDFFQSELEKGTTFIIKSDKLSIRFARSSEESYKRPTNFIKEKYTTPVINTPASEVATNEVATSQLSQLMTGNVFSYPKPVSLIEYLINFNVEPNDTVMDFFAGSATTAHAVMQINAEDGGKRKFIMIQLPETCDEKSKAFKAGYKTIAEISKERIRRAGAKILAGGCHANWNKDTGFRVLKIDTSNMADVYYKPEATKQDDLLTAVDNIKPGRDNPEDLLFQVLVDWGVDLTLPIECETIQNKTVFFVNREPYDLIACFDKGITEELVKELATHKPVRVVFRDNGFVSDAVKINVDQIFRQLSPTTDVKSI